MVISVQMQSTIQGHACSSACLVFVVVCEITLPTHVIFGSVLQLQVRLAYSRSAVNGHIVAVTNIVFR